MMQHVLKVKQEQSSSPVARELEDAFGDHLDAPVKVSMTMRDGVRTMVIKLTARPGVLGNRLVASADQFIWRTIDDLKDRPQIVHFEVANADGEQPFVADLTPPKVPSPQPGKTGPARTPPLAKPPSKPAPGH